MKKTLLMLVLGLSAGFAQAAEEHHEDAASQRSVDELVTVCAACHGEHGDKPIAPNYPILAGQYANYLEHSIKSYRNGQRKNAVMSAQAANLSDADIRVLSRYFSLQSSPLHTPATPK